ncbi:MAG: glutathione S-transferase N-terminal domain-containing protein [Myxococcales bacterium]|nr:glutathione S-transferase N-terminal domain-containing protein [Myxococcales bacterium]
MSIVLHRFPLSHFSEKARLLLDFKGLDYELRDHQLGLPQLAIYRLSGQRKLPVIEHDGHVVSDSTRIAHYLDEQFPETRRLVPRDDPRRSEVLALEERIDRKFGVGPVARWVRALPRSPGPPRSARHRDPWAAGRRRARPRRAGAGAARPRDRADRALRRGDVRAARRPHGAAASRPLSRR